MIQFPFLLTYFIEVLFQNGDVSVKMDPFGILMIM